MISDLRFTLRSLRKAPVLVAVIVLSLSVGIGANASVLCWLQKLVFDPLPGTANQREMVVLKSNCGGGNISYYDSRDFAALSDVFVDGLVSQLGPVALESERKKEWVYGQITSANFFDLLGIKPILGRTFLPEEDKGFGSHPVLVISERLWRRSFGSDPSIIGKVIQINRYPLTIIGVVPDTFKGTMTGIVLDYWAPLSMRFEFYQYDRYYVDARSARPFHNLFRLKPGVSISQAQAAVATLDARLQKEYPSSNDRVTHEVRPLTRSPYGAQTLMIPALTLMLVLSFLVLLIVSANVANLLLARTIRRGREIAIRLATGASRLHLARLLLMESTLLGLAGGCGGLFLASWIVGLLQHVLPQSDLPIGSLAFQLDPLTVCLTLAITLATSLSIGMVPVFQASRLSINDSLKEGAKASAGGAHHRLRNLLVIAEVSLSVVLLICAVLCLRGFQRSGQIDPGFKTENVLLAKLSLGMQGYNEVRGKELYGRIEQALRSTPGVEYAALGSFFPLGFEGCKGTDATVRGREIPRGEDNTYDRTIVSPGFFATLGHSLVAGRDFSDSDREGAPAVVIINEVVAERFWPGEDPLGRVIQTGGRERTVVGVVRNIKYQRLDEENQPHLYRPYRQGISELDLDICVKVRGNPSDFAPTLRRVVRELDPELDLRRVIPLEDHTRAARFPARVASFMLSMLGIVALCLATMGIYAVILYSVNQRTREFGVRMALGASSRNIVQMVLREGLCLTSLGIGCGLVLAAFAGRLLSGFLFGLNPFDLQAFAGIPLLLASIALLACWAPAFRASRVDPADALRAE